jgi:hypothetical protein
MADERDFPFEYSNPEVEVQQLPSNCQLRQVVTVQFNDDLPRAIGTIRGVHFFPGKVKYDVGIWLNNNPEDETRIYNVDSCFVSPR